MSCKFHYTQESIAALDIRHTDSGLSRIKVNSKFNKYQIDVLDRQRELQTRRRTSIYPRKHFEYSKEYKTVLPTAPALRVLPKEKVSMIVTRLYRPNTETEPSLLVKGCHYCRSEKPKYSQSKRKTDPTEEKCPHCARQLIKARQMSRSQEYIADMVERLSTAKISESDFESGRYIRFPSMRNLQEDSNFGSMDDESSKPFSLSVTIESKSAKSFAALNDDGLKAMHPEPQQKTANERESVKKYIRFPARSIVPKKKPTNKLFFQREKENRIRVTLPALLGIKSTLHTPQELHDAHAEHEGTTTKSKIPTKTATHEDMALIMKNRKDILRSAYSAENIPRVFISHRQNDSVLRNSEEKMHFQNEGNEKEGTVSIIRAKTLLQKSSIPVEDMETKGKQNLMQQNKSVRNKPHTTLESKENNAKASKDEKSPKSLLKTPGTHTDKHVTYSDKMDLKDLKISNRLSREEDQTENWERPEASRHDLNTRDTHSRYSNRTRLTV